eukprot:gene13365-14987_t
MKVLKVMKKGIAKKEGSRGSGLKPKGLFQQQQGNICLYRSVRAIIPFDSLRVGLSKCSFTPPGGDSSEFVKACMWNEDETGGGSCNEFRSACSVFNEIEDKCESAKDIRWQSPTKACVHSITDTSNCQDYNACTPATDEAACQAKDKCEWQEGGSYGGVTIGSCQYTDSVDRDEGAPYCAGLTAKKECGPTGSNPAKHCMWIVSDNQICQNYDHCTDLKESQCSNDASCQSQGKGDDFICTAKQGGEGGAEFYNCGNTTAAGKAACNKLVDDDGERLCIFLSKCEAKDCTYYANDDDGVDGQCVTEGDVKGSEDCIGVDNAGDCTNAGSVCEWKDTEAQETCLALDACALFGEDKCNDEDGCGWTRNFDAEGYDDDAAMVCSSEQAANNNEFVQAPSCSTQENQTACDDFSDPFAKFYFEADDDTDGNPECMWNSRTTSYCNAYDKCTNYPSESKCKTDDECHWKANDDSGANQNETPEKSCVKRTNNNNQGAGSGESEADPSQACYSGKETQKDCEAVNKGSRICDWVVTENAYCMNWALCSGRPELENEDDCVAKRGCSWLESTEQCLASELTTTSTTTTTTTTSTTTTTFHCNSDMFLCTTGEQCIREGWYCDGDPDCADESDEVGCPTETTTTSTGTLTTKTAKITTATTKTTTSKTTVTTTTTTTTTRTATTTTTTEPACVLSGECPSVTRYLDAKDPITGRSKYSTTAICRACALDQTIEEVCAVQNGAGCPEATTSTASAAALSTADVTTFEMDLTAAASVSDGEVAAAVTNALGAERDIPLTSILKVEVGVRTEGAYTEISVYSSRSSGTVMILKSIQVKEVKQVVLDDDSPLKIWNPNNYDTSNLMDATEGSLGLGDPSTNIVVVIVPVVVVLLIAIGVLVWVVKRKSAGFQQGGSGQRYENPAYAPGNRPGAATSGAPSAGGLPSWADPNIPFLSRSEAEGQLKQQGLSNGAYVVRQTVNTIAGYVVTATHSGKFANIQLKNNGGSLFYGAKAVGSNLSEAIASLQTSVQVAASGIMPFHLQAGPASGYIGDMDA